MKLEPRTPVELRGLLAEATWQQLFAETAAFSPPGSPPAEAVKALFAHHQITPAWRAFDLERLQRVDRATAERFLAILLQYELAYGTPRLEQAKARDAAARFLRPFGGAAVLFSSIELTTAVLVAKETHAPCSFGVRAGILGSTLEEGLIAFDPAGMVGALFVGDED
jgi:hypothetical protein